MATIKDVARLAGVGLGTASRVVTGKGSVSPATAERVRKAIKQLGFRPSHAARSLLSGSSQTIGVYIPVLKGTFYTPILQTIDMELRSSGRHMVVAFGCGLGDERRQAVEGVEFLIDRGCDGLIVMSNQLNDGDIVSLSRKQPNLVVLNRSFESIRDHCFSADHTLGGTLAAQALLKFGHCEFAIISGPATSPDNVARINGFLAELAKRGINPNKVLILQSDFSPEGGWASAEALLASKHKFTALFCANDEMAVGVLSHFQQAGISVPEQVSVLGYDDTQSAEYSAPRLTSVHIPLREVTLNGLYWLLNQCYNSSLKVEREFPISITWRATVAKAPMAKAKRSGK
ncbi:MAG: LacI family DNA-binding transcriptional regulator [Proteobacteria bacterium]|nr:LacI family DNA-binding transcriptional regulator [Pseudomonadota bacterium]